MFKNYISFAIVYQTIVLFMPETKTGCGQSLYFLFQIIGCPISHIIALTSLINMDQECRRSKLI